jgi:ribonuclease J
LLRPSHLEIIPLGGLGEFGLNMTVYRWGRECLVVDAGMMFPGAAHLGVDVVIPDMTFLDECGTLLGVLLTHGHEDHIGALSYLLARRDLPVYATPYTDALLRRRLAEHGLLDGRRLLPLPAPGQRLTLGPFEIESVTTAHSIPQPRMLAIRTPAGVVVHTADYKLTASPVDDEGTDLARLVEIGKEGVLAVLGDSTNADRSGFTAGERVVSAGIDRLLAGCRRRVVVTTFASQVHRIQELARLANRHGRKLALVGASIQAHVEVAERLGLLRTPPGTRVAVEAVADLDPENVLVVAAGSQGEPMSAMARIAVGKHRHVQIEEGDLVIHSAREIPGNEKSIGSMINHLLRRGADVVTAADAPVHVSGHGARDELRLLLQLLRPRFVVPIHGEYRQLRAHARLAVNAGIDTDRVQLADTGDVIAISERSVGIVGRVHVGQVLIDAGLEEIDWTVLRDRRRIAGDGIVVPVIAVDRENGTVNALPEIMARGFAPLGEQPDEELMLDARRRVADSLREASPEERTDEGLLRARVQADLKRFLRRRVQRQPLVIPVIVGL